MVNILFYKIKIENKKFVFYFYLMSKRNFFLAEDWLFQNDKNKSLTLEPLFQVDSQSNAFSMNKSLSGRNPKRSQGHFGNESHLIEFRRIILTVLYEF